jgi:hypothetical protein
MFLALLARHQEILYNICTKWSFNTLVSFVYQQAQQAVSNYCAQYFPLYILGRNFSAALLLSTLLLHSLYSLMIGQ